MTATIITPEIMAEEKARIIAAGITIPFPPRDTYEQYTFNEKRAAYFALSRVGSKVALTRKLRDEVFNALAAEQRAHTDAVLAKHAANKNSRCESALLKRHDEYL